MKKLLLLIGMSLALYGPSQALFGADNQLTDGCHLYASKGDINAYAECLRDVSAVADIMAYQAKQNLRACIPPDSVANGQMAAVLDKAVSAHAEQFRFSALSFIAAFLSQAFPCKG